MTSPPASPKVPDGPRPLLVALLLVAMVLVAYSPVREAGFVNLDDPLYVLGNPHVRAGLTWESIRWALQADLVVDSPYADYWQPLTFLSRMADAEFLRQDPGWIHVENVLLHAAAVCLLFGALRRATGSLWRSAAAAAIFALHPLQVEAVAWITERKEVLAGVFWMGTLWAHGWYARQPGPSRYLVVLAGMAFGLMAKPVGLTLPMVLLLADAWPLGRWNAGSRARLVLEKVPFALLAAASAWVTWRSQGAHVSEGTVWQLAGEAVVKLATYLVKAVVPMGLAVWHPPIELTPGRLLASATLLAAVSTGCWWQRRTRPYLLVGWLGFLVLLLPVIPLKDIAWAERFAHLPLAGLAVMVAWGAPAGAGRPVWQCRALAASAALILAGMGIGTWFQARYWRDSVTLFERALQVTHGSWLAHSNLGEALGRQGRHAEALAHLEKARLLMADNADVHNNLGNVLDALGRREEAVGRYREALQRNPRFAEAHRNLGVVLLEMGRTGEALPHLESAVRLRPESADAWYGLGRARWRAGNVAGATVAFAEVVRRDPGHLGARQHLGLALAMQGFPAQALEHFREVARRRPSDPVAQVNLGNVLDALGQPDKAIARYQKAIRLKPDHAEARFNLGELLVGQGDAGQALDEFRAVLRVRPDFPPALAQVAWLRATAPDAALRDGAEAARMAVRACRLAGDGEAYAVAALAAAHAENGRFPDAVATARRALRLARSRGDEKSALQAERRLADYLAGRPTRGGRL